MLSFFSKKKHSPDTPTEEFIQGPSEPPQNNGADDFIFVDRKDNSDPSRQPQLPQQHMYPPMPPAFGIAPYPTGPYQPPGTAVPRANVSQTPVPYVQDVPFVLAPQLCTKNTHDLTQTQVDGILALLTRQMSVEGEEYNFALERSVQNECC